MVDNRAFSVFGLFIAIILFLPFTIQAQLSLEKYNSIISNIYPWIKGKDFNHLEDSLKSWIEEAALNAESCEYQPSLTYRLAYFYSYNDEWKRSLQEYDNALSYWDSCKGKVHYNYAKTLYNIGNQYKNLNRYNVASTYYDKTISILEQCEDVDTVVYLKMLKNIAEVNYDIGDFGKSNTYYTKIINLYNQLGEKYAIKKANALRDWATNLCEQKHFKKSKDKFDEAYKLYQNNPSESVKDELATWHYYLSHYYIDNKNYEQAQSELYKAKELDFVFQEYLFDTQALLFKKQGNIHQALQLQKKSVEIISQYDDLSDISLGYENLGDIFLLNEQTDSALICYDAAIRLIMKCDDDQEISIELINKKSDVESQTHLIRQLFLKSCALMKNEFDMKILETNSQALQYFQHTDSLLFSLLNSIESFDSKFVLIDHAMSHYASAINHTLHIYDHTKDVTCLHQAYQYASRYKAILLRKKVSDNIAENIHLSETEQKQLEEVRQEFFLIKSKHNSIKSTHPKYSEIGSELFSAQEKYNGYLKKLEKENKDFAQAKSLFSEMNITTIKDSLDSNCALLEYFQSDSMLFSFIITQNEIQVYRDKISTLGNSISTYRKELEEGSSASLEKVVFEKQFSYLQTKDVQTIYIIPDNKLWLVPFEAIKIDDKYLVEQYTISYAFSSNHLFLSDTDDTETSKQLLALGTSYSDTDIEMINDNLKSRSELSHNVGLTSLNYIQQEIDMLSSIWKSDILLDDDASLSNFKEASTNYKIIHMSLHGVMDESSTESYLIFDPTSHSDYIMSSEELHGMNINAELAVLSACQTGVGKIDQGEGMRSMARNFAHAGCNSLVASTWNSSENTSSIILSDFYKELKSGKQKNVALQNAKVKFLKSAPPTQRHPAYWANLVLIGDPAILSQSSIGMSNTLISFCSTAFLLLIFAFLAYLKNK